MGRASVHSSRELRAAALEAERIQQENEARSQSIEAQIAALRAQQQKAEEDAAAHRVEKEAKLQAARDSSFHEACLKAQGTFRAELADEVYTRVAQILDGQDAWQNIADIAQGQTSEETLDELKIILWEAIAGDGNEFIVEAASKVLERKDNLISDIDIEMIQSSNTCLSQTMPDSFLPTTDRKSYKDVSEIEDSTMEDAIMSTEVENTAVANVSDPPLSITAFDQEVLSQSDETHNAKVATKDGMIASESVTPRRSMTALEEEEKSPSFAHINDREVLSPTASSINFDNEDHVDAIGSQAGIPQSSVPKKRSRQTNSTTPSKTPANKAGKKVKLAADGNSAADRVAAFITHIEEASSSGQPNSTLLNCARCKLPVRKDAKVTGCLHLYHSDCMAALRGESTATKTAKLKCDQTDCGQEIGSQTVMKNKPLQGLRQKCVAVLNDVETDEVTDEDD